MRLDFDAEALLTRAAAQIAARWRDRGFVTLVVGLRGPLGSGKTTWARAQLLGLGYAGRVPSPTYTLVEEYRAGPLTILHVDLYRLERPEEVEFLGIRERLAAAGVWAFVEWPERAPALLDRCDVTLDFELAGPTRRIVTGSAQTANGHRALESISDLGCR